ncbi:LysE family translocator [Desulfopila aestuarii]|uniref:Threonine/homoserine/homoserine lactone efflux protein n=1 Tax=Desulfopila aestuarii DSM 18488 TaxID=1121416 RepID=A0A1M7XXQ3_9BACT|nr:LysE family translocator [Desulfopila aestuarii]SHO43709.1 Threonine/homoserine/homoserine lactone efflux protein [Desulfopila aestuarii DSM 18488]
MEIQVYAAFVIATAIMIALPGPSVLLTVAHSISFGSHRALATVAGATVGIAVQLFVAALGLASLLNGVAVVFEWLRWCGAAYLVYLGIKQWRGASEPLRFETTTVTKSHLFVQGVVVTIPNPKSLIFIAAFLPQFIDVARPVGLQFAIILPTFLVITFAVTSVWALAAGKMSGFVQSQKAFKTVFRTTGGLMILSGVGLALARRGN